MDARTKGNISQSRHISLKVSCWDKKGQQRVGGVEPAPPVALGQVVGMPQAVRVGQEGAEPFKK